MRVAWLAIIVVLGCGATTRKTVSSGIDEFAKRPNYEKLGPASQAIAAAVTSGVLDTLAEPERERALAELVDQFVDATMKSISEQLDASLGPAIQRQLRATVRSVIDEALAEPTRASAAEMTTRLTLAVVGAIGDGIGSEIGPGMVSLIEQVGPALRASIERDLGPAMRAMIERELAPAMVNALATLTPALGTTAETVSHAATRGALRAVDEWGPAFDRRMEQLKDVMSAGRREVVSTVSAIAIAGMALLLGVAVVLLIWRHLSAKKHDDALQLVTQQIKQMESVPAIKQLTAQIKTKGRARPGGPALDAYLTRHNLKVAHSQASEQDQT